MNLETFNYPLPKSLIAQKPAEPRTNCRLMVVRGNHLEHKKFYDITDYFQKGDLLIINNAKVSKVKIIGKKSTGSPAALIITGKKGKKYICRIKTKNPLV